MNYTLSITDPTSKPYTTANGGTYYRRFSQVPFPITSIITFPLPLISGQYVCHIMASHSRGSAHISSQSCFITSPYQLIT